MMKVLVIDNEPAMLEAVADVLDLAGMNAVGATSGRQGLDLYRRERDKFDLVILDMRLSGAMGGAEVLEHLRTVDPSLKVIISTGYSEREVQRHLNGQRWDALLLKPYNIEKLIGTIDCVLQRASQEQTPH